MRKAGGRCLYTALIMIVVAGLFGLPVVVKSGYLIHLLILTGMYTALALSYDLVVGHVGLVSLAHPSFFGVGGYVAAILGARYGTSFILNLVLAGVVAGILAFLVSKPFFRLAEVSFAIGTLGFAVIMQLLAKNEVWLTGGPMCTVHIPQPHLSLPPLFDWHVSSVTDFYYLMLGMLLIVVAICWRLTTFRMGRAFISIREDQVLASAAGVDPLKYKTFAFVIGAWIAGSIGVYWAQYATVMCPSELGTFMTTSLLIMLFLGGVGKMRGVILGAVVFTLVPELLRITPTFRMVIYGVLLLVAIVYVPDGLDGLLTRWLRRRRGSSGSDVDGGESNSGDERSQTEGGSRNETSCAGISVHPPVHS